MTARAHRREISAALESEPDLEALYVRYHEFVRRALSRHYVDPNDLDDMTQHVFLVLLRRVDEATQKPSLGAWLYQIARRVAANHRRGRQRLARKHGDLAAAPESSVATASGDPEERYAREEAWSFIREFLESLDEEACAVFVMSEIEGLRGADIAARLRLTLPMTYARIRSVRARFDRQVARARGRFLAGLWTFLAPRTPALAAHALAVSWRLNAAIGLVLLAFVWLLATRGGGGDAPDSSGSSAAASERREDEGVGSHPARAIDADAIRRGPDATGVFGGVVVDLDGAPIPSATVCADRGEDADHRLNDPPACVTTDGDGHFEIHGALDQAHALEAMARGFVPGRFRGRPTTGVRLVLHPGGVELSGVVSDVHGGPVEGAWVAAENRAEETLGATARTDETGAFSLWVLEGPISLGAGAEGYAATFSLALAPSTSVQLELGAESVIAGVVVDAETGKPIEGIRVGALLHPGPDRYANRGRVAFSDAAGRWEIRGLQPNHYVMDAAGERSWGRAQESIDLGIGDHRDGIRIEMIAGVDIVGRIFDADTGEGCVDGSAKTFDAAQSIERGGLVHGDGLVAVEALTGTAVYEVIVSCRDYESRTFDMDLSDGPVGPQEWPLKRGGELVVRVLDHEGAPLQDWHVEVSALPSRPFGPGPGHGTTSADGVAVVAGVSPGRARVIAEGPGHPPIVAEDVDVAGERPELELRASLGVSIGGTVTSSDGHPVVHALVALQRPEPPRGIEGPSGVRPYHAVTDDAGRFRHASVAAGEYGVWVLPADTAVSVQRPAALPPSDAARVAGEPLRTVRVSDRELTLELEIGALSSISGIVRDEEGDLLLDAQVFAVREHEGDVLDPRGRPRLTDRHGRYRIDDLPPGTYSLTAYHPGGGIARRSGVKAGARAADLVFPRRGRITGAVKTADGTAVEAYALHIGIDGRALPFVPVGSKHGRFIAAGLEAGRYTLYVDTPEGSGEAIVELAAGESRSGIAITLEPRGHVKGRLVDREGKPLAGWIAGVRHAGVRDDGPPDLLVIDETSSEGTFTIPAVFPAEQMAVVALETLPRLLDPPQGPELFAKAPELRIFTPNGGETIELGDIVVDHSP